MTEPKPHLRPDRDPPRPCGLTRRQRETLDFIHCFYLEYGTSPSYAEIAAHLGNKVKQGAYRLVRALEARGAVTRRPGQPRSLAPVLRNAVTLELPPDIDHAVRVLAQRARTTPEAVIIEAVHERLAGFRNSLAIGPAAQTRRRRMSGAANPKFAP
jgi:LexA DNA binding domain